MLKKLKAAGHRVLVFSQMTALLDILQVRSGILQYLVQFNIAHGSGELCEATPIGLVDESKESCAGARRTETCAALRHKDASHVVVFLRTSSVGEGGALPDSLFYDIFPVQPTTSGIGHRVK